MWPDWSVGTLPAKALIYVTHSPVCLGAYSMGVPLSKTYFMWKMVSGGGRSLEAPRISVRSCYMEFQKKTHLKKTNNPKKDACVAYLIHIYVN